MLSLPTDYSDAIALADWLELKALLADDSNSSINDLVSPLRIASGSSPSEAILMEVFSEIEARHRIAGRSYPFRLEKGILAVKPNQPQYAAYLFCLALSHFGWKATRNAPINPWHLFEDLACIAAKEYLDGDVIRFGARCRGEDRAFRSAVETLCMQLGEGKGYRDQSSLDRKDDKVDLVAWKHFRDNKPSKVVMFGQCAAGANWKSKVSELNPRAFWDNWLVESRISPTIRSFYIPHRIPADYWDYYARYTGVLFDRCRVCYWAYRDNKSIVSNADYYSWFEQTLRQYSLISELPTASRKQPSRRQPG